MIFPRSLPNSIMEGHHSRLDSASLSPTLSPTARRTSRTRPRSSNRPAPDSFLVSILWISNIDESQRPPFPLPSTSVNPPPPAILPLLSLDRSLLVPAFLLDFRRRECPPLLLHSPTPLPSPSLPLSRKLPPVSPSSTNAVVQDAPDLRQFQEINEPFPPPLSLPSPPSSTNHDVDRPAICSCRRESGHYEVRATLLESSKRRRISQILTKRRLILRSRATSSRTSLPASRVTRRSRREREGERFSKSACRRMGVGARRLTRRSLDEGLRRSLRDLEHRDSSTEVEEYRKN